MKLGKTLLIMILLIVLVNLTFVSALTGSMGNAKMVLYPEVNGWFSTTIEKSILTKNVNDVPINVTLIISDDGSKEFLELIDESFILQPGENKNAEFLVRVKKEGRYNGRIVVTFNSIDPESKAPGVALSSTIIVIAKKDQDYKEVNEDEETDDENSEINETDENGTVNVFGGNKGSSDKETSIFSVKGFLIGSSVFLLVILLILGYLVVKKTNDKKKKKRGGKKSGAKRKKK
jgi:hypothetical protein